MELLTIQRRIYTIRNQRVMLDFDLAVLYGVQTKVLNQAVKRNIERFPDRFMFRLTKEEWQTMRSQFVTASEQHKRNTAITPYAFTEHGVTMLSSILKSKKAIQVNIAIVEAFITLKEFALNFKQIAEQLKALEIKYNKQFKDIYEAIQYLMKKDKQEIAQQKRRRIGFKRADERD